jgi:hypothetical protein
MNAKPRRTVLEVWMGDRKNPQLVNCLESPTDGEIAEQLKLLPGGDQISTIELHISKTHHIAIGGSVTEGFYARYREFSRAGEWETVRDDLSLESAANLIASYRDQIQDWKRLAQWKRRAVTDELQQQRSDQEAEKMALWLGKAVAFFMGFFKADSKSSRKSRRK